MQSAARIYFIPWDILYFPFLRKKMTLSQRQGRQGPFRTIYIKGGYIYKYTNQL